MCWTPCERVMNCMVSAMTLNNLDANLSPNGCTVLMYKEPLHCIPRSIRSAGCTGIIWNALLISSFVSKVPLLSDLTLSAIMSTVTYCRTVRSILKCYRHWHSCYGGLIIDLLSAAICHVLAFLEWPQRGWPEHLGLTVMGRGQVASRECSL